jgi:hypothetical protein
VVTAELAAAANIDAADMQLLDLRPRGTGLSGVFMLSACSATASTVAPASLSSMSAVYAAWEAVRASISEGRLLAAGDAATMGGGVAAEAMYDPECAGAGCPSGPDPFYVAVPGPSRTPLVVAVVCGVAGALILGLLARWLLRRHRLLSKSRREWEDELAVDPLHRHGLRPVVPEPGKQKARAKGGENVPENEGTSATTGISDMEDTTSVLPLNAPVKAAS